MSYSTLAFKN